MGADITEHTHLFPTVRVCCVVKGKPVRFRNSSFPNLIPPLHFLHLKGWMAGVFLEALNRGTCPFLNLWWQTSKRFTEHWSPLVNHL